MKNELDSSVDDVALFLINSDVTKYDEIADTEAERVMCAYYSTKVELLNKVISDINSFEK